MRFTSGPSTTKERDDAGQLRLDGGDYSQALRCFKKAIALDPHESRNYRHVGEVYARQRRYAEAAQWFKKAIEVDPQASGNYRLLGLACKFGDKPVQAMRLLKKAIEVDPRDSKSAIPPLYGALVKNEQDVHLLERLAFMNRRES